MANKSWKCEVIADDSGKWCGNGLRFASRLEAEGYVRNLSMRWFLVKETRVVESEDHPKDGWNGERLVPLSSLDAAQ